MLSLGSSGPSLHVLPSPMSQCMYGVLVPCCKVSRKWVCCKCVLLKVKLATVSVCERGYEVGFGIWMTTEVLIFPRTLPG